MCGCSVSVPITGQVAVTGTAQPLSTSPVIATAYSIKAPASNAHPVFLGKAGVLLTTGHQLDPGDSLDYQLSSQSGEPIFSLQVSDFFVVGTSGDVVTWLASQ